MKTIKLPAAPVTETGGKKMWALRLTDEQLAKLDHAARIARTSKTALIGWLIEQYYDQQVIAPAKAKKK